MQESSGHALQLLMALAAVDRSTCPNERQVLEEFRQHLGITTRKARAYLRSAHRLQPRVPDSERARVDQLAMLLRVAWSDGVLCEHERAFLSGVARTYELPPTTLARLMQEAQDAARARVKHTRRSLGTIALALLALVLGYFALRGDSSTARAGSGDEMAGFKLLEARYASSVLLVHTRYLMHAPGGRHQRIRNTGTGFFLDESGLVATNKHVVQPWKFSSETRRLQDEGYEVDVDSLEIFAWPGGTPCRRANGSLREAQAYSLKQGTLSIVSTSPDVFTTAAAGLAGPGRHAADNNDLALLHCEVRSPVRPLPLRDSTRAVTKLDAVMVMGFPRGLTILEGETAACSPVLGRVRKAEDSIYITAPIVPGNSGGPLIDAEGYVVGIATRVGGDSTLGCCIRAEHVARLVH